MNDSERLRRFVRSVVKVSRRKQEQEKARHALGKQMEKIKTLSEKKGVKKASVSRALKELEKKIAEVIEKEKQSIALQEKDLSKTKDIALELKGMEDKFSSFTTKDIQIIAALKEKIEQLESQRENQVDKAVEELKSKIRELESATSNRDKRIIELEHKIKQKVSDNFLELIKIEKQLEDMEIKYKNMKREGRHDRGVLKAFKSKIEALKQHLFVKKKKVMEEQMEKGAPLPELPEELTKMPKLKPLPESFPRLKIKHDLKIKPLPELPKMPEPPKPEEESFSEILEEEDIPEIELKREIKKRGFFKKLFG